MVRRYIVATLMLLAALAYTSAETHYAPHVSFGAKGGLTMSQMGFSPSVKQSMAPGVIAGVTVDYAEEKLFGLRAELLVEQRGWSENFEEANDRFNYTRRLTYVQLPLLTTITFGSPKFKCLITLGPEVSYMIGNSISANFDYHNIADVPDFPLVNRTNEQLAMEVKNKFDYGISAGVGGQWMVNRFNAIALDARLYYGLANIFPDRKKDTFSASRGMSVQLTLGYNIRLK